MLVRFACVKCNVLGGFREMALNLLLKAVNSVFFTLKIVIRRLKVIKLTIAVLIKTGCKINTFSVYESNGAQNLGFECGFYWFTYITVEKPW